jgi:predicted permease
MRLWARTRSAFRSIFRASRLERDLDDELRFALEELTLRYAAAGLRPEVARRAAQRELGALDLIKEDVRAVGLGHHFEISSRDVAHAVRRLWRARGFTLLVVVVLAAGIGAATAIFSVVNALLLSPLPYRDANRLVFVWQDLTSVGYPRAPLSGPELKDLRHRTRRFSGLAGIWANTVALTDAPSPEQLRVGLVTPDFFEVLGADASLGRTFRDEDYRVDGSTTILLSSDLWQRRYGGDRGIVGRQIQVNGRATTVIGVMPESFKLLLPPDSAIPDDQQAWLLLGRNALEGPRQQQFLRVVARMKPGVGLEDAKAEVVAVSRQVGREFAEYGPNGATFYAVPLKAEAMREMGPALVALFAAVSLLLAIGCVNVAGLLVTRAASRHHETTVRLALGASHGRLFRQMLTEGVLLSVLGGGAGVLLAQLMLPALLALRPPALSRMDSTTIDLRVLAFAALVSVAWGILFSLAPLSQTLRANVSRLLQTGGRSNIGGTGYRVRAGLVVTQVAISSVLLVSAGLMGRGFYELNRVDLGFEDTNALTFKLSMAGGKYRGAAAVSTFSRQLRERLGGLPGVEGVGASSHLPYDTVPNWGTPYLPEAVQDEDQAGIADARAVTPGYFEAVGAQLIEGRWFTEADDLDALRVAIVDAKLANRLWPGASAVGKCVKADPGTTGSPRVTVTIVGVVRHLRHRDVTRDLREQMYFPAAQSFRNPMAYVINSATAPEDLVPSVRQVTAELDPTLPIYDVRPLRSYTANALATRRFTMIVALSFALSALLLTAIGVFGVVSYAVGQRRREFGLRVALGARTGQVLRLVLVDGLRLTGLGAGIGSVGALVAAGLMRAQLYCITPYDPLTFAIGIALVVLASVLACWLPAHRAARTSPVESLQSE